MHVVLRFVFNSLNLLIFLNLYILQWSLFASRRFTVLYYLFLLLFFFQRLQSGVNKLVCLRNTLFVQLFHLSCKSTSWRKASCWKCSSTGVDNIDALCGILSYSMCITCFVSLIKTSSTLSDILKSLLKWECQFCRCRRTVVNSMIAH